MSSPIISHISELPNDQISFDIEAFDEAIRSQGLSFIHERAMRCPVGIIDPYDQRRPDSHLHDTHNCSNGFLYTEAGQFTCIFIGNNKNSTQQETGLLDAGSAQATIPRFYDGTSKPVHIAPFDRISLTNKNITVINWQLVQFTGTMYDKLSFPPVEVHDLVDNTGKKYSLGDFEIRQNKIHWIGDNPGIDPDTGKGRVYTIRYTYVPVWYIKVLLHELRITQADNVNTGIRSVEKMPQAVQLQREFVFLKEEPTETPSNLRESMLPESGSFGPR
jgi:hypothetical protein